jgi:hypothetical protein
MDQKTEHDLVIRICRGNKEAEQWMQLIRIYVHLVDDIIDEDIASANRQRGTERMCALGALNMRLHTHPFFLQNGAALHTAMLSNIVAYADSVAWENETGWKKTCSDWLRHGSIEIVMIIAAICGGYEHMRSVSQELRTLAYEKHHDANGNAI